ncbi:MAG: metal ABC transporter ATP-binding protein [Defluviitaleaceae bacterium]|nr:metal ABC transporter ATP-binding protein [Defluviitaleaceae bacterium]
MEMEMIKVSHLSASYLGTPVLKNVNFEVPKGVMVGIIGPNGAGKSTLIKAMLGLIKSNGQVQIGEKMPHQLKSQLAYMKQGSDYDLNFPISVKDVVMLGLYPSLGLLKRPKRKHHKRVADALRKVEMEQLKDCQIAALSGGQWQRVLIARILVQDADVLFLDEPFTGVDADSEANIVAILRELRDAGKSIFMIYHDLDSVTTYFDQVILLNKTVIAYGPTADVFTDAHLKATYMRGDVK